MALTKCKECGKEVSTAAAACPHCGCVLKKKAGCLRTLGGAILVVIAAGVAIQIVGSQKSPNTSGGTSSPSTPESSKVYGMGQTISVGYTSYAVYRAWWSSRLSDNPYLDQKPNAEYLFVDLAVRNDDSKARTVPPFKLLDDAGAEYETSNRSWGVQGSIGVLEDLNPSVGKRGYIVFDVPRDRNYRLKLSGGFWSSDAAYVRLSPTAAP
jgi:hypothetical protein